LTLEQSTCRVGWCPFPAIGEREGKKTVESEFCVAHAAEVKRRRDKVKYYGHHLHLPGE
jgi:hypothetical protein